MADAEKESYTKDEYLAMVAERDALTAKNREVITEKQKAITLAKQFEGIDPEEHKRLKTDAEERARKKATDEGDFKTLQQQMAEKHQAEIDAEKKRTGKALTALEKRKVAKLTEELAKAGALPEFMELLTLKGSGAVRLREGEDDWDEYVADEKGTPLVADGAGTPMTLAQYVETTLKTQYAGAFKGTGSSGGGASKSNAGGGGNGKTFNPATSDGQDFLRDAAKIAAGEIKVTS